MSETGVYGPVPSRRLGRSLGVDLVPFKTCTYDCVYCQLGRTTRKTLERSSFCDVGALTDEVRDRIGRSRPDYITLAGSGEPTLEARLGDVMESLKRGANVPLALLTNGSLLWDEEVQRAASLADVVMPSLDAGDEAFFQWVNRPAAGLTLDRVLDGLASFRRRFDGAIWLEVMVLAGRTEAKDQIERIASAAAAKILPDCIHLNTPVRPGGSAEARAVDRTRLEGLRDRFVPSADVVCDFRDRDPQAFRDAEEDADIILVLLRRRPCTVNEIVAGLGVRCGTVRRALEDLQRDGAIRRFRHDGRLYYTAAEPAEPAS